MAEKESEDELLRSVALQNARSVLLARQRAEEALRKQSEWLRITLASIGDAVISTDSAGLVTFMNGVAESLTGWSQGDAIGRPLADVFHIINERTREPVENPAHRAMAEGTIVGLANHTILVARQGKERPIDDSAAPIRDDSGTPVGAVLVFRDVTERKQAEEVRARLAAIVESSHEAIVGTTLEGVIRSWNAGAERLFGYTAAEAIGQSSRLFIPPDLLGADRAILERLHHGERIEPLETVRLSKDGRRLDILVTISPIRDDTGHIIGVSRITRDITERKRAEGALRESEARYRAFFEQGTNFAGVLALDGTVVEANRLSLSACGFVREDVIGKPFWECGWWNRSPSLVEMVRTACFQAAAGQKVRTETTYFVAGGAERMVELILAPVTDAAGRVLFVAATGTDVTERRRMEDTLREQDRRKDEFLALLAHELRAPLAPLRNGLEVMRIAEGDASAVAKTREMMERQLGHMVRLIDDLLDVSRITCNKVELRRSRVLLAEVVNSAVEISRPMIDAAGHELTVSLPPAPVYLDADLTRLAQVFGNLLTNSAKYTEPGGHIWLSAALEGGWVAVVVRDTGIGISSQALPKIFDMFSQVDRSIERSTGGLGIGLALVKGLVEMHDGTVKAASGGPGKGSTFTVRLPLFQEVPEPPPEAPVDSSGLARAAKRRILVVDDNRDSANSMAIMLRLMNNEVRTAYDGVAATEVAEVFRPQVILMDVGMPKLNGYDATRHIRMQPWGRGMIIIALTGWGQEEDRRKSQEAGFDGHMVKPIEPAALEKLMADFQIKA